VRVLSGSHLYSFLPQRLQRAAPSDDLVEHGVDGLLLLGRWWSPSTNLPHEREKITHTPVVGYFAVLHAHAIDRLEVNFAMGWSEAEERSFMRPVVGLVGSHTISISNLPVDLRMKVGKRHAKVGIELPDAGLVGSCARLRCVVNKILSEEFLEEVEVPTALHFFGIAADDSFCVLG